MDETQEKPLCEEAVQIIKNNLELGMTRMPTVDVLEFIDLQAKMIEAFVALGYTRERFFKESRAQAVKERRIKLI